MANLRLLEANMIPLEDWGSAPEEARRMAEECQAEGVRSGIALDPFSLRWFVLTSSNGFPRVGWEEDAQCEGCGGTVDDVQFREFRSIDQSHLKISPCLCSDCVVAMS